MSSSSSSPGVMYALDGSSDDSSSSSDDEAVTSTTNTTTATTTAEAPLDTPVVASPSVNTDVSTMTAAEKKAYYANITYSDSEDSDEESSDGDDDGPCSPPPEPTTTTTATTAATTVTQAVVVVEEEEEVDWDAMLSDYSKNAGRKSVGEMDMINGAREGKKSKKIMTWQQSETKYRNQHRSRRMNKWIPSETLFDVIEETPEDLLDDNKQHVLPHSTDRKQQHARNYSNTAFWREDSEGGDSKSSKKVNSFRKIAGKGTRMIKHNNFGFSHKKLIRVTQMGQLDWFSGSVSMHDIVSVQRVPLRDTRFVVLTESRRIDLEANSPLEREIWVIGLQTMVKQTHDNTTTTTTTSSSSSSSDDAATAGAEDTPSSSSSSSTDKFKEVSSSGVYLIKHGLRGKPTPKLVMVNHVTAVIDWESRSRPLQHATISAGKPTKQFKRVPDELALPEVCLSLTWKDRELNLQCKTQAERDFWVIGLQALQRQTQEQARHSHKVPVSEQYEPWKMLAVQGVLFVKHGRYGKPHKRMVLVDTRQGTVQWGKLRALATEEGAKNSLKVESKTKTGTLDTVQKVVTGKITPTFKRVKDIAVHPELCFSVVWEDRTLDLQAGSARECKLWVHSLGRAVKEAKDPHHGMIVVE